MRRYARPQNLSFKTQMHLTVKTACGYIARVVPSRRQCLVMGCWLFAGALVPAGGDPADVPFDVCLRKMANPKNLGLCEGGRFYSYASAVGQRIGYGQGVAGRILCRDGRSRGVALASFGRPIAVELRSHAGTAKLESIVRHGKVLPQRRSKTRGGSRA
jgi:hypothetical protein